jgi:hypothetical protein
MKYAEKKSDSIVDLCRQSAVRVRSWRGTAVAHSPENRATD